MSFDPIPNAITELLKLIKSPRVQYTGKKLIGTLPMASGPFSTKLPSNYQMNAPRTGASSNLRKWAGPSAGSAFGNTVGSVLNELNQNQQTDPMMELYNQLLNQLQQPVNAPTGVNTTDLMTQVRAALDPIYNQRADAAKNQEAYGQQQVKDMYRALSNDYERLAPEQVAQAKDAQDQIEGLYGQLRSNIEGGYARVSKEQSDLFNQLGIQDALPTVTDQQTPGVTDALTAASENQAQQQQRYLDIGQMDSNYYREQSPISTMAGNETQQQMLSDLNTYLNQIEAERTSGIQTSYMDQLNQANSQLASQQQNAQNEAARRQEMLWQILQSQMQNNQQSQALTPDSYMNQLPSNYQQSVAGAFNQLERSPEAVYGKVEDPRNPVPGSFVDTTPQWYMQQADQMYQNGQIDATTHQALLMYLQLYFKTGQ